ncbi:hypothetical protein EVAR_103773_1 [Eumeta japonica]|uniref:Uncharacterized protein n=1 Tax=Eumeta variegata TaxID=151549 RepID=A0A4C2ABP0_EUMVA|nr:hypothetical protein EVAR_103773_1 [Eumeta japonica]
MSRYLRKFQKTEAFPYVMVPRHCQSKEEDVVLQLLRCLEKSLVGVQKYIQATDLSEASREAVEEKLRATDRQ